MKFTNKDLHPDGRPFTQEEFINKIKTDDEFAKKWGELGPIYGSQWRSWGRKNVTNYDLKDVKGSDQPKVLEAIKNGEDVTKYGVKIEYQNNSIDQIANLINELKTNPDSRRLMVSAWNVGELSEMVLPPCHFSWQCYSHEKDGKRYLSLAWNQRSCDLFLGIPFNIASYGLLLEIIAKAVNMVPDELIGNLGDTHLYSNHIEQAKEQIGRELTTEERVKLYEEKTNTDTSFFPVLTETLEFHNIPTRTREPFPLPTLRIKQHSNDEPSAVIKPQYWHPGDFVIENYQSHPSIKAPLSN